MTQTLTTERLREIAERRSPSLRWGEAEQIAAELLANREAQPVEPFMFAICNPAGSAWLDENCVACTAEELKPVLNDLRRDTGDGFRIVPVYTAPPAPAVPDDYCIMPLTLTAANGALSGEFKVSRTVRCYECGGEGCDDCADAGEFEEEITIPWDTIKEIYRAAVDSCRAAMLAQPVSQGYKLPDNVREALTLALQAMEFMGDTLNNIDAVCTEDVEYVTPAFTAVRELLAAAPEVNHEVRELDYR